MTSLLVFPTMLQLLSHTTWANSPSGCLLCRLFFFFTWFFFPNQKAASDHFWTFSWEAAECKNCRIGILYWQGESYVSPVYLWITSFCFFSFRTSFAPHSWASPLGCRAGYWEITQKHYCSGVINLIFKYEEKIMKSSKQFMLVSSAH